MNGPPPGARQHPARPDTDAPGRSGRPSKDDGTHHQRHLARLLEHIDLLVSHMSERAIDDQPAQRRRAIAATLALDGSPATETDVATVLGDDLELPPLGPAQTETLPPPPTRTTWHEALNVRAPATAAGDGDGERDDLATTLLRHEIVGTARALASDDLAAALHTQPWQAVVELHRRLTMGLVDPQRAGCLRTSQQSIVDTSTGKIVYFVTDPSDLPAFPGDFDRLISSAADSPIVPAARAQLALLAAHPFDAANGRLARATTALLLRSASGSNGPPRTAMTAALERIDSVLAEEPMGYHAAVAAAQRGRDPAVFLTLWTEALEQALIDLALATSGAAGIDHPIRADHETRVAAVIDWLVDNHTSTVTLAEVRDAFNWSVESATDILRDTLCTGALRRVRGSAGLRFVRPAPQGS